MRFRRCRACFTSRSIAWSRTRGPSPIWGFRRCWCLACHTRKTGSAPKRGPSTASSSRRSELKRAVPSLVVIADTCLCEYTTHAHCGIPGPDDLPGFIDNDRSLELIARTAVAQAEAGADIVAPSDMLDGRVQAIRAGLVVGLHCAERPECRSLGVCQAGQTGDVHALVPS